MQIEEMSEFFTSRIDGYDEHMLNNVEGKEQNILEGEFYHYDTPCTIHNQIELLTKAGFKDVNMIWRVENTTIIVAKK